ncbi:MAG TPA: alpha/beta family hydrolase [Mycobacteriales bacterium]|nr:alpha/beta family hydrolase [Mycobacteriales bacterium]
MAQKTLTIEVPGSGSVTAVRAGPKGTVRWLVAYAPGAGSNVDDPFGVYASDALAAHGVAVVRIQFPYMEAGKKSPDRPAVLEATWRAVIERLRGEAPKIVVGGRSMGGRIASQVVAQGVEVDAVALFAYPLHPPGKPEQQRVEHFPSLRVPVLFCSGTNDAFASPEELQTAARMVQRATVHLLEGADHGFAVRKSSGRSREDVWAEAVEAMVGWLGE